MATLFIHRCHVVPVNVNGKKYYKMSGPKVCECAEPHNLEHCRFAHFEEELAKYFMIKPPRTYRHKDAIYIIPNGYTLISFEHMGSIATKLSMHKRCVYQQNCKLGIECYAYHSKKDLESFSHRNHKIKRKREDDQEESSKVSRREYNQLLENNHYLNTRLKDELRYTQKLESETQNMKECLDNWQQILQTQEEELRWLRFVTAHQAAQWLNVTITEQKREPNTAH